MEYPCGVCSRKCGDNDTIFCEECTFWHHRKCEELTPVMFKGMGDSNQDYVCRRCNRDASGSFNYEKALRRLSAAATKGFDALKGACDVERIFLRKVGLPQLPTCIKIQSATDRTAEEILHSYCYCPSTTTRRPARVNDDGNCLFHALSLGAYGNEDDVSSCLRVWTCMELTLGANWYEQRYSKDIALHSPTVQEACLAAARNGAYSSAWAIAAASSVLHREVFTLFPPVNGPQDKAALDLSIVFYPRHPLPKKTRPDRLYLMWTSTAPPTPGRMWIPNHFVSLVTGAEPTTFARMTRPQPKPRQRLPIPAPRPAPAPRSRPIPVPRQVSTGPEATPPTSPLAHRLDATPPQSVQSSPIQIPEHQTRGTPAKRNLLDDNEERPAKRPRPIVSSPRTQFDYDADFPPINASAVSGASSLLEDDSRSVSLGIDDIDSRTETIVTDPVENDEHQPSQPIVPHRDAFPNKGRFLETDVLIEKLLQDDHLDDSDVPNGIKENVYFMLNNKPNVERRKAGKKGTFFDDCGVYSQKGSMKTHYFIKENARYRYVDKKDGKYMTTLRRQRVPLEPQPSEDSILILKRLYSELKRDSSYKRRISWIDTVDLSSSLCIEYIGKFPDITTSHGNAKSENNEYVRTQPQIKEKIKGYTKAAAPRDVYAKMLLEDSINAPRDLKQVQNVKYHNMKEERGSTHRKNTADDVQHLLTSIHDHPFIQQIVQTKGKPAPSVIVYTKEQLQDVKKICENGKVIGVDRTFNLGPCYVTLLTYHNFDLRRRLTQAEPIFMGPAYLHWDGTFETYHAFFSHLQCKFDVGTTEVTGRNLVLGSDEEHALTKAMRTCFPTATHTLCTRHIEENIRRYLEKKVGLAQNATQGILRDIFGKDGLLHASDDFDFDQKTLELSSKFQGIAPTFVKYFEEHASTLKTYVFKPYKDGHIPLDWKNNSCESMNHILKLSCNWKALRLPDLIEKIYQVVKLQYADVRRALHGQGNFELAPSRLKFKVSDMAWKSKTEEEKLKLFEKFMAYRPPKDKVVTSTDGHLQILKTPRTAKKQGQSKRVKNAKTSTWKTAA